METFPASVIRVSKKTTFQATWRDYVAAGAEHPLKIEEEEWVLLWLLSIRVNHHSHSNFRYSAAPTERWTEDEKALIEEHLKYPKIAWALDNSFDGLYFHREEDHVQLCTYYRIGAYLKGPQATYWKLKYG